MCDVCVFVCVCVCVCVSVGIDVGVSCRGRPGGIIVVTTVKNSCRCVCGEVGKFSIGELVS